MVSFLAHFDGRHLLPEEPVDLPTGKPLRVTVEEVSAPADTPPLNLAEVLRRDRSRVWFGGRPEGLGGRARPLPLRCPEAERR